MFRHIAIIAALAVGCGGATTGGAPDAAANPDAAADPDGPPPRVRVECDDLEPLLDLTGQVSANAGTFRTVYPLVLAHGFAGFDRVGPLEYFAGVADRLRELGFATYVTAVEPMASTDLVRGPELAHQVACIAEFSGAGRVNLIGHSQGGLDTRFVASDPEFAGYVASVTTIATPHQGTVLADVVLGIMPGATDDLMNLVADLYGLIVAAPEQDADLRASMVQMSEANMLVWNPLHPDNPNIRYFSWAGRSVRSTLRMDTGDEACAGSVFPNSDARDPIGPSLLISFDLIAELSGVNDGLVTVSSARRGTFMGCVPADHFDQIGLLSINEVNPFSGFSHLEFFATIAETIAGASL